MRKYIKEIYRDHVNAVVATIMLQGFVISIFRPLIRNEEILFLRRPIVFCVF
jgi:hypothetical protein